MRKWLLILFPCLLFWGCSEPEENIEAKLSAYLQDDLKFMVAQTLKASHDKSALLDSPYFKIRDLRFFDVEHSKMYSAYADVDFFIYRDIKMYEERKYRYDNYFLQWDRYLKRWHFGDDVDKN
ncbi:MAG: hypothetical protein SPL19_07605 [Fibrobacter sp.]|nr:hypothetical protein [Fibrobacter sp.]MDY6370276.1 hypothetical protein [Fibrobacter sp.]MDY6390207.1 hypothetical protein [Fibrobacter sp.]